MKNRSYAWIKTDAIDISLKPSSPRIKERKIRSIPTVSNSKRRTKSNSNYDWGWTRAYLLDNFSPTKKRPCSTKNTATIYDQDVSILIDDFESNHNGTTILVKSKHIKEGAICTANSWEFDTSASNQPPNDLCQLTHLHEPAVICCLKQRYSDDQIYTSTGPILLALNPFKRCKGLYSHETLMLYRDSGEDGMECKLPPHVYAIADDAYRKMLHFMEHCNDSSSTCNEVKINQSILVSGESGAGKTQTTKFIMQYITTVSQKQSIEKINSPKTKNGVNSIEQQILLSNPVLESFGNARTIRNDNSSRFGKFIEIKFSSAGVLVGASIETYCKCMHRL